MNQPLSNDILFHLGPVPVTQIVVVTWVVMGVLLLLAVVLRLRLRARQPGAVQQIAEAMREWLAKEIRNIIGRDPEPFIPLVASLFIFFLASNLLGLISSIVPSLTPPTANINTTAALAGVVFLAVPVFEQAQAAGAGQ